MELLKGIGVALFGLGFMFFGVAGFLLVWALWWALPTFLLWNWIMPDIFGLTEITIWQAIGLNLLSGILFRPKSNGRKKKKTPTKTYKKEIILG